MKAVGYGVTEQAALYQALGNAVRKANGTSITPQNEMYIQESSLYSSGVRGFERTAYTSEQVVSSYRGYVKNYEILSSGEKQVDISGYTELKTDKINGTANVDVESLDVKGKIELDGAKTTTLKTGDFQTCFYVSILAEVYQYRSPFTEPKDKMVRIAITEFDSQAKDASFADNLAARIGDVMTKSNKFNVLDRKYQADFASEKGIWLSDDANIAEKARLSMVIGADMMLSGNILQYDLKDAIREQAGRRIKLYKLDTVVEYSLISAPERTVKHSDKISLTFTPAQLENLSPRVVPTDFDLDLEKVQLAVAEQIAQEIAHDVADYVYPILVAKVDGDSVYLNQGNGRLEKDQMLKIYSSGEEIKDPQTGLSLGSPEKLVGLVKVQEPLESMSLATLLNGDISEIEVGDRCRPFSGRQESENEVSPRPIMGERLRKEQVNLEGGFDYNRKVVIEPKTIAVIPPRVLANTYRLFDTIIPSETVANRFSDSLTSGMTKTRRFDVLDRAYQQEYDREIDLIMQNSTIDNILNVVDSIDAADYLLVGTVSQFYVAKDKVNIAVAGLTSARYNCAFRYDYRIIDLKTRKIAFSDSMNIVWDDDAVKQVIPGLEYSEDRALAENTAINNLLDQAAQKVCSKFVDQLYPIEVIARSGNRVAVNAGNSVLTVGRELEVFDSGPEMIDPHMGHSLGKFESVAGSIYIVQANSDVAYGEIRRGGEAIAIGSKCHPIDAPAVFNRAMPHSRKTNVEKSGSGGVHLPYDHN